MAGFDHGVLNVPLSKRGDINAELDRFKAQQAAEARANAKAKAAETRELRRRAKELVAGAPAELLAGIAARTDKTAAQVRADLASEAHWNPRFIIRALGASEVQA